MTLPSQQLDAAPLPLAYYGHPALTRKSKPVAAITPQIRELAARMVATMREADGIGLAAPQVGVNLNLIVIEIPTYEDDEDEEGAPPRFTSPGEQMLMPRMPLPLVNPKLSMFSEEQVSYNEGCLSIPKLTAKVFRSEFAQLDAMTLDGEKISVRCGGLLARCLMHELDHLNGILFIDLISAEDKLRLDPKLKKMYAETTKALKKAKKR